MCGTSFESAVCICNGTTSVIVEMGLNVALDNTAQSWRYLVSQSFDKPQSQYHSRDTESISEQEKGPKLTPHQVVDLSWGSAPHCIRNSNAVHANLVNGTVDREKIDEVGTERVLAGKPNLETLGLDELNDLDGSLFGRQHGVRYRPRACEAAWALALLETTKLTLMM